MAAGEDAWAELMKVSFGMVGTSVQAGEMMIASGSVVGARLTLMGNAACSPADGDYDELGEMVPEKVVAFTKAGQACIGQWSAMAIDTTEQAQDFSRIACSGRPLGTVDLHGLAESWLAHGTRMIAMCMATGGLAMAPLHQQATENARRLG